MAKSTRAQTMLKCPKLHELLGNGLELCLSELPTLRDSLRYGILLRDRSVTHLNTRCMCIQIFIKTKSIWMSANSTIPLVSEKYAVDKLVLEWKIAKDIRKLRTTKKRNMYTDKLDKLFDLTKCKCNILSCNENGCNGCLFKAHVTCICPKVAKIPLQELFFLQAQRNKIGNKSSLQIGLVDTSETHRLTRYLGRKESGSKIPGTLSEDASKC